MDWSELFFCIAVLGYAASCIQYLFYLKWSLWILKDLLKQVTDNEEADIQNNVHVFCPFST